MEPFNIPADIYWISGCRKPTGDLCIETCYFKTVFEHWKAGTDAGLTVHISANNRYCLYVNGVAINNGPCRGDAWHQYCDTLDLSPYLVQGKNVIAAKVTSFPVTERIKEDRSNAGPFWAMTNSAGPMLIVWSEYRDKSEGTTVDISTGRADWYVRNDDAIRWHMPEYAFWMGCTEEVDGSKIPKDWYVSAAIGEGFEKAKTKWNNIIAYGEIPSLLLYKRPIALLSRISNNNLKIVSGTSTRIGAFPLEGQTEGVQYPAGGTYEFILDAGRLTTSFVHLLCEGGRASRITLLYSEGFEKDAGGQRRKGNRNDQTGVLKGVTDIYLPGGGQENYSPSWFRTFRFIKIKIETAEDALTIYPLQLTETRYPLVNKVSFTTGQSWVEHVWDISLRTLALCMHETYEDCPFYEQLQYVMDTRLQILFTYAVSNSTDLPRKTIHDFHDSLMPEGLLQSRYPSRVPQVIPTFSLHWIFMLRDYYMETGDLSLVARYRPTMESVLAWFFYKTGPQGLIEKLGYWEFADWTDAWDDLAGVPRAALHGPSTIHNLVYACALETGAFLLDELGYSQLSSRYRNEKDALLRVVDRLCWSEERQLYQEGPSYEEYTQHAQTWAVLSGLAEGEKARRIMRNVLTDASLIPCSFVMQYYLFRALEKADMYEETEALWPLWAALPDMGLTTIPEIPGEKTRSDCHAWGALLLHELPRKFLGVSPLQPGYNTIRIKPMGLFIREIAGEVPTPHGPVSIAWQMSADGRFRLDGSTPKEAQIELMDGSVEMVAPGRFSFECHSPNHVRLVSVAQV